MGGCGCRFDFQREIATLRCLNDANVVRLLGVVVGGQRRGDPTPCIVTEYLQHGDLKQYLQRHRAQDCTTLARGSSVASLAGAGTLRSVSGHTRHEILFNCLDFLITGRSNEPVHRYVNVVPYTIPVCLPDC